MYPKSVRLFSCFYLLLGFLISCQETSKKQEPVSPEPISSADSPKKVWIDADIAIGVQNPGGLYGDVDDGFAVIHLLKSDKISIKGISTVFGNTDIDHAYELGIDIRDKFASPDLQVYKGAAKALDLSAIETNDAVEAMAQALHMEKLHILAIGPATNVGILLLLYPELGQQMASVILVAGRRSVNHAFKASETHDPPFMDFNFELDPEAFRILLQTDVEVVLHPFEISHKVWFGKKELDRLAGSGVAGEFLANRSRNWLKQWGNWGVEAYNPFDLLASAYLISAEGFQYEHWPVEIRIAASDSGAPKTFKPYLVVDPTLKSTRKVFYYHTAPDSFTKDFFDFFE